MIRRIGVWALPLMLSACVVTGPPPAEPDYAEAARLNTELGVSYFRQGRLELAQSKLEKALEQDDSIAATHATLALVFDRYGDYDKAETSFEKALRLDAEDPGILNNYAAFLCGRDRGEEAKTYFVQVLGNRRYKTPEVVYNNLGVCERRMGDDVEAEAHFRRALDINPEYPDALFQMAQLMYERADYLRARAFLARLQDARALGANALLLGLRVELQLGDDAAARDYAQRLQSQAPDIARRIDLTTGQPL